MHFTVIQFLNFTAYLSHIQPTHPPFPILLTFLPLFQDYAEAQGLTYGAIIISIVINLLVQYLINFMTQHECHDRMDSEKANKMVRVFAFYYFNMAFSVLIAYGFSASVPPAFAQAHIFQGPFPDFNSGWYAVVGVYFCTSFVLAIVTPIVTTLVTYYLVTPLSRMLAFPKVKEKSSRDIVTQKVSQTTTLLIDISHIFLDYLLLSLPLLFARLIF